MRFLRWVLVTFTVLATLYLYFATLHSHQRLPDHAFFDASEPWAIAHQGGRGLWPENTLYAFAKAKELGVDVLEMDLRATVDGAIVVMHDASVDRTTEGSGRVDEMTLAEVRELDAGYRFEDASGQFPHRGRGLTVPKLEDVLSRFSTARLIVEMKEFTPELAAKLCRILEQAGATDRVLVASFGHDSMRAFREACPAVATSATMREGLALYQLNRMGLASLYRSPAVALQIPERLGERRVLEPRLLELADAFNIKVQVWTVNDEADMKRLLDMGVQGIITDYPDRLLRLMGRASSGTR
ncbi:MAG: glycerophosphodiester phosphodiesterase [Acidobacteriota bacterium]|nr:MAG: glycerophosphodiester phosphodiesterase [Acidobacteriota bacterium]